ncbi:MAG: hypothetical protein MZV63_03500 [Marinilabiliales bacterium]|nr:hypothetical protein [Marinilabiliales bacterium]
MGAHPRHHGHGRHRGFLQRDPGATSTVTRPKRTVSVIINRIKPHVAFRGPCESGLMKMMHHRASASRRGADMCHELGFGKMGVRYLQSIGTGRRCESGQGSSSPWRSLENAYHETARIVVLSPREVISAHEPRSSRRRRSGFTPRIHFDTLDVLDQSTRSERTSAARASTRTWSAATTRRIAQRGPGQSAQGRGPGRHRAFPMAMPMAWESSTSRRAAPTTNSISKTPIPNALTSTVPMSVKIPMVLKNDSQAIQAAIKTCNILDKKAVRFARIKNTVAVSEIEISESLIEEARANPYLEVETDPRPRRWYSMKRAISYDPGKGLRSDEVTAGMDKATSRSLLHSLGVKRKLRKPLHRRGPAPSTK